MIGNQAMFDLGCDGSLEEALYAEHGGAMIMNGHAVFRNAVRSCVRSVAAVLECAKVRPEDVNLFVPHQANRRIIEAVAERIGIPIARCATTIEHMGNTSAASIPLALHELAPALEDGDLVLLAAFGAGMTWATGLVRWGAPPATVRTPADCSASDTTG